MQDPLDGVQFPTSKVLEISNFKLDPSISMFSEFNFNLTFGALSRNGRLDPKAEVTTMGHSAQ